MINDLVSMERRWSTAEATLRVAAKNAALRTSSADDKGDFSSAVPTAQKHVSSSTVLGKEKATNEVGSRGRSVGALSQEFILSQLQRGRSRHLQVNHKSETSFSEKG
jgi:hypothetical protein